MSEQIAGIVNDKCVVVEPDAFEAFVEDFVNELLANHFGRKIVIAASADWVAVNGESLEKLKDINAEIFIHTREPLSVHNFIRSDYQPLFSPKDKPKPFWANDWRKKHKR